MRRREVGERRSGGPWAAAQEKLELAREMRASPTSTERQLWEALRRSALGFKFRRQHVIAGYVVDFYCPACRLAIEVDGPSHDVRTELDERRDAHLTRLGVTVLRFSDARVNADRSRVLREIRQRCLAADPR